MVSLRSELDHLATLALEQVLTAAVPSLLRPTIRQQLVSRGWAPAPFRRGPLSALGDAALVSLLSALADDIDRLLVVYDDALAVEEEMPRQAALEQLRRVLA
jgi:hypothetical protein